LILNFNRQGGNVYRLCRNAQSKLQKLYGFGIKYLYRYINRFLVVDVADHDTQAAHFALVIFQDALYLVRVFVHVYNNTQNLHLAPYWSEITGFTGLRDVFDVPGVSIFY